MKKFCYLIAAAFTACLAFNSCDDDKGPEGNYGDLSIRPEIKLLNFHSKTNPQDVYELKVDPTQPTDTTFYDYIVDKDNPQDTTRLFRLKASYVVYQPVVVPCALDTFVMRVNSNACWTASTPTRTGLFLLGNVGNGSADATFRCTKYTNKNVERSRVMFFYSNDSTTMHKVTIVQPKAE